MDKIVIRKITIADLVELQTISKQTFFETFADHNAADDMQKYLDNNLSVDQLKVELSDENSEFYFASSDNKVIGYLKINFGPAQTEIKDKSALEIERIYVLKDFHGKKVGQILFNKVIDIAKQTKAGYIWLGVWEKNLRAINFYKKNGFLEFDKHIFRLGDDEQTDIMMRLTLSGH
ncbi:MAG: GNAT family N-acetyltransferase [Crocinitomix sp.]|nr:GNAT family N-acetyltransferase [Crocinitomix sp.]